MLRAGVVGVGHLGRHHARIYNSIPGVKLAAIADTSPQRRFEVGMAHDARAFADYRQMVDYVDMVSIVVPTIYHLDVARPFIEAGVHVLIEKPLAHTVEAATAIVELAKAHNVVLQVGHIERFNPALEMAAKVIADPRYMVSDRLAPYTFRSGDIGVVLDLMVHDLDIILEFVNSEVQSVEALGLPVLSKSEDIADARLRFDCGAVADLKTSRVSFATRSRRIRIYQPDAYVSIDYNERKVWVFRKHDDSSFEASGIDPHSVKDALALVKDKFIDVEELPMIDRADALTMELQSFTNACRGEHAPVVPGEHGLRAVSVARLIQGQIQQYLVREAERLGLKVPEFVTNSQFGDPKASKTQDEANS